MIHRHARTEANLDNFMKTYRIDFEFSIISCEAPEEMKRSVTFGEGNLWGRRKLAVDKINLLPFIEYELPIRHKRMVLPPPPTQIEYFVKFGIDTQNYKFKFENYLRGKQRNNLSLHSIDTGRFIKNGTQSP